MNIDNTRWIAEDFRYGDKLTLGEYVIVEPNVVVGNGVKIGHRVTLKSGTIMGDNSIIDDHCMTTGACYIGNNVNIRSGAIISKATIIEDYCFIGPGVITNHTKHVSHGREAQIPDRQLLTYIRFGTIVGSQAVVLAGVSLGPQVIVGAGTVVVKDLEEKGVYVGSPAQRKMELPVDYLMTEPEDVGVMYLKKEILYHLKEHIPNLEFPEYFIA
jgi:acetyltransferase-like isoleucine patch superfamily enzyme